MPSASTKSPVAGQKSLSVDDYSDIVGAIYECVIDPAGWPAVLTRMYHAVGGVAAWIAVHDPGQVRSVYEIEAGTDPEQQQRLRLHYLAASPFIGAVHYVARADILSVRLDAAGASVLIDGPNDDLGLLAHVMPLTRARNGRADAAVAALFLTNPAAPSRAPIAALVARFGLTPSKTRVLVALLEGRNPRAIAATQGIAMPTVRTHLRRLYDKTGARGQADVVRLVASLGTGV